MDASHAAKKDRIYQELDQVGYGEGVFWGGVSWGEET